MKTEILFGIHTVETENGEAFELFMQLNCAGNEFRFNCEKVTKDKASAQELIEVMAELITDRESTPTMTKYDDDGVLIYDSKSESH